MADNNEVTRPIQYFVFMKAETTGRQWEENREKKTKILELSLIAVNRQDLERGHPDLQRVRQPRTMSAISKLNMFFCPERNIQSNATSSHNLTNSDVRYAPPFKQSAGSIVSFLQQFPKPVCLVAINGFSFDYKHLLGECIEAGIQLPHELLCADARFIFHHILKTAENRKPKVNFSALIATLLNENVDPVSAEDKVLKLIRCAKARISEFLFLADTKCKPFSEILIVGAKRTKQERHRRQRRRKESNPN